MTPKAPSIAVVIPTHNREDLLLAAVRSVASQRRRPDELVVVDDASTVPIDQRAVEAASEGIPLTMIRNEQGLGSAGARNLGVARATSSIIAFLDSDDAFLPSYLQRVEGAWMRSPRSNCICSGFWWCTPALKPYRTQIAKEMVSRNDLLEFGNLVGGCSVITVNRLTFLALGGFEGTGGSDDWRLLLRMSKLAPISVIQSPQVLYRNPDNPKLDTLTSDARLQRMAFRQIWLTFDPKERSLANRYRGYTLAAISIRSGRVRRGVRIARTVPIGSLLQAKWLKLGVASLMGPSRYSAALRQFNNLRAAAATLTPWR